VCVTKFVAREKRVICLQNFVAGEDCIACA
jgi:hypothetical protein